MAQTFNCPSCGAPLQIDGQENMIHCEYCGASVIVPAELQKPAAAAGESLPAPALHPSQVEGPHGQLTSAQMRQMMTALRAGQLDQAIQVFQEGTGGDPELARQTVQMISSQLSASSLILPAALATIMRTYAESASRYSQNQPRVAAPRRRGTGLGCWLVLLIVLLIAYFSYVAVSPVALVSALIAGHTNDAVVQTAIAPIHMIATAIAPLFH